MEFWGWLKEDWFTLLQSLGIVGGLLFTAASLRLESRAKRVANLLALTGQHREVWTQLYRRPGLSRILAARPNLRRTPIRGEEELFVSLLVLHLASAHQAIKSGVLLPPEGLAHDVRWFFSLPIPRTIWDQLKPLQDADFVRFVDACLPPADR